MADQDWKATLIAKLPEVLHVVLSVLGILILILAITKGITYQGWLAIPDANPRMLMAGLGVLVLLIGLYLRKSVLDASLPKKEDYGIVITSPVDGASIVNTDVRGLIKKTLPESYTLWIFRVYEKGTLYPMKECIITQNGEGWVASNCDIAGAKQGEERRFSVRLVGPRASELIDYMKLAEQVHNPVRNQLAVELANKGMTPDLPYLPLLKRDTGGMVECAWITVKRA